MNRPDTPDTPEATSARKPAADAPESPATGSHLRDVLTGRRKKDRIDDLAEAGVIDESKGVSLVASAWRRLRRNPIFLIGAAITAAFVLLALLSPLYRRLWRAHYGAAFKRLDA